jgi:hypothetical protein
MRTFSNTDNFLSGAKMGQGGSSKGVFHLNPKKPFNGIIAHFTALEYQGNPARKGYAKVTASSTGPRCMAQPENVLDVSYDGEWSSNNAAESWICVEFLKHQIELSAYSIQTFSGRTGTTHMKSWRIEASNEGVDWVNLDQVQDDASLNHPNAIMSRKTKLMGCFRMFRIYQMSSNWFGTNCLTLKRIEFFGKVFPL